jgi:histone H3/H4
MGDVLVVQSKVREAVKNGGANMSGDFAEALSAKVADMVSKAVERAKANGRKTVRGYDL